MSKSCAKLHRKRLDKRRKYQTKRETPLRSQIEGTIAQMWEDVISGRNR